MEVLSHQLHILRIMKRYLSLASFGFLIGFAISALVVSVVTIVPWERQALYLVAAYFSVSTGFVACFPAIVQDIFARRGKFSHNKVRLLAAGLAGGSLGLFLLGWSAVVAPQCVHDVLTNQMEALLCVGPAPDWQRARELASKLLWLGTCKTLLEGAFDYMTKFAAISVLLVCTYDTLKAQLSKRLPAIHRPRQ